MGVRFYDKENMSTGNNYDTTKNCHTCKQQNKPSPAATTSSDTTTTKQTTNTNSSSNSLREIVGNNKEIKIQDNSHSLRIIGNNNCVRILFNMGNITIIGNNTRLKIKSNHGLIKYNGNNGRISLGHDSTEQLVDYSGCNGVLKIHNSKNSSQANNDNTNNVMGSTNINAKAKNSKIPKKEKYNSYSGSPSTDSESFKCCLDYDNVFNHKKSMPPLYSPDNEASQCTQQQMPKTVINNFDSIVITNSSHICINPSSFN